MLNWTPLLNSHDKVGFIQCERFIASRRVASNSYWVGPADTLQLNDIQRSLISVAYSSERYENTGPLAISYLYMNGKQIRICSRLSTALSLLTFMFDSPTNLQTLSNFDPELPVSQAIEELEIRYANFLTPKVGQYLPGEHLAKTRSTWRYYLVEDYGEVVPLADCEFAAPLVARAWADQEAERTDLASRLAKFIPPDSVDIIAGRVP